MVVRRDEAAFLAVGPGASQWLVSAAAVGSARIRSKMIAAMALAKNYGPAPVDRALRRHRLACSGQSSACRPWWTYMIASVIGVDGPTFTLAPHTWRPVLVIPDRRSYLLPGRRNGSFVVNFD